MSRIFDALQRTGIERSGVEYPDVVSVVTQVLESPAAVKRPSPQVEVKEPHKVIELKVREDVQQGANWQTLTDLPTISVNVIPSTRLVFMTEPEGLAAEKFRFLAVRLRQLQNNRGLKKILVSSTIPEEGKSLVSANVAGVLARRKQKVLLIDGDLRRPVLAEHFGLSRLAGLTDWLQSDHQKAPHLYRLQDLGFWFMPAGCVPTNPLELMSSAALSQMIEGLAEVFDWIIVDSPPLLPLADTTVWARVTDGILLVARVGKTDKNELQRGLELVKKSDLIGVVLNGCEHTGRDYYQRYVPASSK